MKYEIQRYYKYTHTWESVCFLKDLFLAEQTYDLFIDKFKNDLFRLICALDFEEVLL